MSILPVCLPVCLGACGIKHTSRTLPGACDTSLEPSRQKKSIHEKKIPLRARRAPAVRSNVFCTLHNLPQNDFLDLRTNKIT